VEPHDLFLLPLPYLERKLTQTQPIQKLRVESILVHWEALELDHIFSLRRDGAIRWYCRILKASEDKTLSSPL